MKYTLKYKFQLLFLFSELKILRDSFIIIIRFILIFIIMYTYIYVCVCAYYTHYILLHIIVNETK
jgi:hypothetical protein